MSKLFLTLFVLFVTLPMVAEAKIKVVASFSILGDMVQTVTGDLAEVKTIVGPNADAHIYSPNVADAVAVTEASVIFVNGMGFETWSEALIENSKTKAKIITATDGITPFKVDGEVDPHAWNTLSNGMIYVENIINGMSDIDPENAAKYRKNGAAYLAKLKALHAKTLANINSLPIDRRTVVTAHDAFGYLAEAYNLTFLAPQGIDTDAEPSAKAVADLIKQLKKQKVAALFVENITSPDLVNQIAKETGLRVGGRLFSDALSTTGGPATTYLSMFQHNIGVIYEQLSRQ